MLERKKERKKEWKKQFFPNEPQRVRENSIFRQNHKTELFWGHERALDRVGKFDLVTEGHFRDVSRTLPFKAQQNIYKA